ncbi:MAG: exonuclease domain-containing protein [Lachnospiraceae bacterium]|nr:exonuclease domain-containing protein [Lachnospiraceae bacterium]
MYFPSLPSLTFDSISGKNIIVLDLEWNQGSGGTENSSIPFEIIEIGAVKLDGEGRILSTFDRLVRPQVYKRIHFMTRKIIHLRMRDLEDAEDFTAVMEDFLSWCGENFLFATWGTLDLTELQYNMQFYEMEPLSDGPFPYLDAQKLFSLHFEDGKSRRALEYAVDFLELHKDEAFHRADSDAWYASLILQKILGTGSSRRVSFDVFHLPRDKDHELHIRFDTYSKYISREFADKHSALSDPEVLSCRCAFCNSKTRRRIDWYTLNSRHYLCLCACRTHGLQRGKIRIKKSESGGVYVMKTIRRPSREEAALMYEQEKKSRLRKKYIK